MPASKANLERLAADIDALLEESLPKAAAGNPFNHGKAMLMQLSELSAALRSGDKPEVGLAYAATIQYLFVENDQLLAGVRNREETGSDTAGQFDWNRLAAVLGGVQNMLLTGGH